MEFESKQYTGTESSGFVEVIVIISGGSSTSPISVMVTTSEQTATGKGYIKSQHKITTSDYCTLIGSGVDFDSNPINITFAAGEVNKSVSISVMCDKIVEETEKFSITLTLTGNNPQVTLGKNSTIGIISDSTGKWWNSNEYKEWYDGINYTVIVNFNQSSYEVIEGRGEVMIVIELNQRSSQRFEVIISLMDITAECE